MLGLGYVGCVTAGCLAHLGHRVVGIDPDAHKVSSVLRGEAPFYEPDLEELIQAGVASGRLSAVEKIEAGLQDAGIAMVCVGTPSDRSGDQSLDQLERACRQIAEHRDPLAPLIVAIRSTVYPGTCERVVAPILKPSNAQVVANPESRPAKSKGLRPSRSMSRMATTVKTTWLLLLLWAGCSRG